jgi:two-component system NtrC family response regulator
LCNHRGFFRVEREFVHMSTVLVVDDEPLIRWAVSEVLEDAGYGVIEAGSAHEAMDRLAEADGQPVAVAVLDLRLPDSDDLSLMRRVRDCEPGCQVILMTAHGTSEVLREAVTAGAFGTISKPFDLSRIVGMVRAAEQAARGIISP